MYNKIKPLGGLCDEYKDGKQRNRSRDAYDW